MTKKEKLALENTQTDDSLKPGKEDGSGDDVQVTGGAPAQKPAKKTVEVDEGLLRELINSNKEMAGKLDKLESNAAATNQNGIQVRRKVKDFDYNVRIWDNKVVVAFENVGKPNRPLYVYSVYNSQTRQNEQFINLVLEDGSIVKNVDYLTFLRDAERVKARKISQVEHEDVKEYGMIPKKEMAENGYGMFETMVLVPVEVVSKTYTFTVKLPEKEWDGREIEIASEWVNI